MLLTYGIAMSHVHKREGMKVEGYWQKPKSKVYT
jgi:hypothetical protein